MNTLNLRYNRGSRELSWLLLRMLSRDVFPELSQNVPANKVLVSLWKGYNFQIIEDLHLRFSVATPNFQKTVGILSKKP